MSELLVDNMDQLDINRTINNASMTPANEGLLDTNRAGQIDVTVSSKYPIDSTNSKGLNSPRRRTLSPLRGSYNRSLSPGRIVASRQRERTFTQSPERLGRHRERSFAQSPERSFVLSKSPDRSRIWTQWDMPDKKKSCMQNFNIKQMEWLYGKPLGGQVDSALEWYREKAQLAGAAPISDTPRSERSTSGFNDQAYKRFVGSPYKNTEMKAREQLRTEKNLNKLSTRHRVQRTPGVNEIRAREAEFTNDAIVTERRRTRFKDIIPQYDASADKHCKAYFKRKDVQQLISVTRSRDTTPAGAGSVTPGQTPAGFTPRPTPGATPW